jgi:outer membrane protein assembly factor BamE (lipoprotein component of BamABCDE complex)
LSAPSRRLLRTTACRLTIGFVTVCACACTSAIDRTPQIERARFKAGVTTKRLVVDTIGLPARVDKDAPKGTETWYYTGKARAHGNGVIDGQPVILACVFASDGRLLQSFRNEDPR